VNQARLDSFSGAVLKARPVEVKPIPWWLWAAIGAGVLAAGIGIYHALKG